MHGGNWLRRACKRSDMNKEGDVELDGRNNEGEAAVFDRDESEKSFPADLMGDRKLKIEVPDWIYVTFTVTLHCFSLSKCHILSWKSAHPCHISASLRRGSKILLTVFCIRC